jgi:adenylate cyclase
MARAPALADGASRIARAERKQGTVLFADIVGSTTLIADLDPEQAMERLRPAVMLMTSAVQRFGGTVMRLLGDGIMAVFGAPKAQEAHALLACQAAIAIQRAIAHDGHGLEVRVGLHSGELVVSQEDDTREPVPHGVTIHLANRLEQMAEPGTICLTDACYRNVKQHCDVRPLGSRDAKGFARPIETYALLGFKPAVASQQFRSANIARFQNREHEFEQLVQTMHRTENGDARAIGISAAAGTGKSRLCFEFAEWCRRRFIPVLEARALVSGQATALQPILEFLRSFLGLAASDDETKIRSRVTAHAVAAGLDPDLDVPLICQFLGTETTDAAGPAAAASHARLVAAVARLVTRGSHAPTLIIMDDLHWLDAGSAAFVAAMVRALPGSRTMLLTNFRQSYSAPWMQEPHYTHISLGDLESVYATALVDELIADKPELQNINARIVDRCSGNPFFAEELVRSLSFRGLAAPHEDATPLPATVEAVIGARIDGLLVQDKAIVQIAAIIGKDFAFDVLTEVSGVPRSQLEVTLDRLHDAQFVQTHIGTRDGEFSFRHPLIQEVAYSQQLKSRRAELHATVAVALENRHRGRLDEFAGLIAYHYEAAGKFATAATFAARAATWVSSSISTQAVQHWQDVRRLLANQPRTVANDTLRMRAAATIAMFGWRVGMTSEETKTYIDEALVLARQLDSSLISLLLAADGRIGVASGGPADTYTARIREATAIAEHENSRGRLTILNTLLSHSYLLAGLPHQALAAGDKVLHATELVERSDEQFIGLNVDQWMRALRGRILVRLGRFDDAARWLDKVLAVETLLVDPAVQFIPHFAYVDMANLRGDAALAAKHARRIDEIAKKSRSIYLEIYALGCDGLSHHTARDYDAATHAFQKAIELVQSAKASSEFEAEMIAVLADCHLRAGRTDTAIDTARDALALAQQRTARLSACRAALVLAEALTRRGTADARAEAQRHLDAVEVLIAETGSPIFAETAARARRAWETPQPA